jgi:hypothetical protein
MKVLLTFAYLTLCYLSVAPLFIHEADRVKPYALAIATTLGLLLGGLIFVFGIMFAPSIPSVLLLSILLGILSAYNVSQFGKLMLPQISAPTLATTGKVIVGLFFVFLFGGTTLVGDFLMGRGDYPHMFFNFVTSAKLSQSFSLTTAQLYPPILRAIEGFQIPYHYGAPATVTAFAVFTGNLIHKSMFWFVGPILVVGTVSTIVSFSHMLIQNNGLRILAIVSFLPGVYFGSELTHVIASTSGSLDSLTAFTNERYSSFLNYDLYNPQIAGGGVTDVSVLSGRFLLLLSFLLFFQKSQKKFLLLSIVLILLMIFCKMDHVPALLGVIGAKVLITLKASKLGFSVSWAGMILGTVVLCFVIFGYSGNTTPTLSSFSFTEFSSRFVENQVTTELKIMAIFLTIPLVLITIQKSVAASFWPTVGPVLIGVVFASFAMAGAISLINIEKVYGQIRIPSWIIGSITITVLITCFERLRYSGRLLVALILSPLIFLSVEARIQNLNHARIIISAPSRSHEYINNKPLGDALRYIPINETLIVTNDFRSQTNEESKTPICASWGHQAYGVLHNWRTPGKARERIRFQQKWLSSHFRTDIPGVAKRTLIEALNRGWTHFLFYKLWHTNPDAKNTRLGKILPPREAKDFPLELIYENEEYIVMRFPDLVTAPKVISTLETDSNDLDQFSISRINEFRNGKNPLSVYGKYVLSYHDLTLAWGKTSEDINQWGERHWINHGKEEGRSLPKIGEFRIPN